ncbi:MAG: hypothetical protein B7X40_01380, partial [Cellulomonas sp. 14-74-6]
VLAQVAALLAEHEVSIEAVRQSPAAGDAAHLVITTHIASEANLRATVAAIAGLAVVRAVLSVLRVEGA